MIFVRVCLIVALLFPALCWAEETSLRDFQLPTHGSLQLSAPRSWKDQLRQPPRGLPPTIVFTPSRGNGFQVLITPMWNMQSGAVPAKEEIYRIVSKAAEDAKRQAVEPSIAIVEIRGASGTGYYFSATDRVPKPGEFTYMTQGMLRIGELAATFTILANDSADAIATDALQMLKGARHILARAL